MGTSKLSFFFRNFLEIGMGIVNTVDLSESELSTEDDHFLTEKNSSVHYDIETHRVFLDNSTLKLLLSIQHSYGHFVSITFR